MIALIPILLNAYLPEGNAVFKPEGEYSHYESANIVHIVNNGLFLIFILWHIIKAFHSTILKWKDSTNKLQEQTEILHQKSDELKKQSLSLQSLNEELQNQAEELQAQSEELLSQSKHLHELNEQLILKREQEEVARQQAEESKQEAEQANHAKGIFLATMSHEIRTPMNGVIA